MAFAAFETARRNRAESIIKWTARINNSTRAAIEGAGHHRRRCSHRRLGARPGGAGAEGTPVWIHSGLVRPNLLVDADDLADPGDLRGYCLWWARLAARVVG